MITFKDRRLLLLHEQKLHRQPRNKMPRKTLNEIRSLLQIQSGETSASSSQSMSTDSFIRTPNAVDTFSKQAESNLDPSKDNSCRRSSRVKTQTRAENENTSESSNSAESSDTEFEGDVSGLDPSWSNSSNFDTSEIEIDECVRPTYIAIPDPEKQKRGRPRKLATVIGVGCQTMVEHSSGNQDSNVNLNGDSAPVKRKRGRPRKISKGEPQGSKLCQLERTPGDELSLTVNPVFATTTKDFQRSAVEEEEDPLSELFQTNESNQDQSDLNLHPTPAKRKRGRPRKLTSTTESDQKLHQSNGRQKTDGNSSISPMGKRNCRVRNTAQKDLLLKFMQSYGTGHSGSDLHIDACGSKRKVGRPRKPIKVPQPPAEILQLCSTQRAAYDCNVIETVTRISKYCSMDSMRVCCEVLRSSLPSGKLPEWESILDLASEANSNKFEENFESTFCHLLSLDHFEYLQQNGPYTCAFQDCCRRFKNESAWRKHQMQEHEIFPPLFQCPFCKKCTIHEYRIDAHISKVHVGLKHPYPCPVLLCDSRYYYKNQLNLHMTQKHPTIKYESTYEKRIVPRRTDNVTSKGQPYKVVYCKENGCSYRTTWPKFLQSHIIKQHQNDFGNLPYTCDTCGRSFKSAFSYRTHRKYAHKGQAEMFSCTYCLKKFPQNHLLNAHIKKRHQDVAQKYSCSICTRTYFKQEDCKSHEQRHSKSTGWTCILGCRNDDFGSRDALVRHVTSSHEQIKESVCHICGTKTTGPSAGNKMDTHMKSHSRAKTYKCRFCEQLFRHQSEIVFHEQMTHGNEPGVKKNYKCDECGEEFHVYCYYYRHRRNKHGSNPLPKFQRKPK